MITHLFIQAITYATISVSTISFTNPDPITVSISGNCDICKKTIETTGESIKGVSVNWNKEEKQAKITFDKNKTSKEDILKKIALAGYDNEQYLSPDEQYNALAPCCRYDRTFKTPVMENSTIHNENEGIEDSSRKASLKPLFSAYFNVKNSLVASDPNATKTQAMTLKKEIKAVNMKELSTKEHAVWMKVMTRLSTNAESMSKEKSLDNQRALFAKLSEDFIALAKSSVMTSPVYIQHCPMYGNHKNGNWLSQESQIKNPYYGAKMLTCGNLVEELK